MFIILRTVNFVLGEHKQDWYTKLNPQQTLPTLDDNGDVMWDSHAIVTYLIDKYAPNDPLYPTDPYQRALINQRLFFDAGVLYPSLWGANLTILLGAGKVPQTPINAIIEAYDKLETLLDGNDYVIGDHMTVADFSCVATVSNLELHTPVDAERHPRIRAWIDRMAEFPNFEDINLKGAISFGECIEQMMADNRARARK